MISKTHRLSTCHRHPTKPLTGFCASCLRERLAGIESSSTTAGESAPTPELRRTKSCSGGSSQPPSSSSAFPEPRRRSCEVRAARNTLWDLFNLDEKKKVPNRKLEVDSGNSGFEIKEEEEEKERGNDGDGDGMIRVCGDGFVCFEDDEETKTMKEFIDLELQSRKKDFRDIAGSFCMRLRKWRRKQKLKKNRGGGGGGGNGNGGVGLMSVEVEKQGARRLRETQSEVGEYGLLGRRSCDIDPRLSIDAGRMSLDGYGYDSRFSFDAPRASWDGYLIGKACSRLSPMVAVNGVDDNRVLVEEEKEVNLESGGEHCPGGSVQTKDYYSDSLSWQRRRRSFDRSNSHRKPSMEDVDELRVISNAKVSPATTELFYGANVLITEKDLRDGNLKLKPSSNVQSDCVMGSASKDDSCDIAATGVNQKGLKKFHKWGRLWNKLRLVQRRREDKLREEECAAGDVVNRAIAESWQKLRRVVSGHASGSVSQKLIRSYSVSCRNPCRMAGFVNGFGGPETNGNVLNERQEFMLQRNRSVRYSPNNVDTGLLRFYLTPLKSYRQSRSGKSSLKDLNPTTRSVL